MVLVPANMSRFGFNPCKRKFVVFEKYLEGLFSKIKYFAGIILKIKLFYRNYSSTKWVHSLCATCANHHKSGVMDQNQNETYLQGPKTTFFLQGLKPKQDIFAGIKTIF